MGGRPLMATPFVLVLGGTRSGKSRYALDRIRTYAGGATATVVATATPGDPELDRRIARHRADRPADWPTIDAGLDLAAAIRRAGPEVPLLIEGLTLWLSTLAGDEPADIDPLLDGPVAAALDAIVARPCPVVVVSDELGLGMVPLHPVSRAFRDLTGLVHQRFAAAADEVEFVIAGLPMPLKKGGTS
jgi:adenosylcobinamide kinase/adenosylcobinamide-phosphate guanylyltransferase